MANSLQNQIINDIAETLRGVSSGSTYNRTLRAVYESPHALAKNSVFDCASITEVSETKNPLNPHITQVTATIQVVAVVRDSTDVRKAVGDIQADIETALLATPNRGGLAIETRVTNTASAITPDLPNFGSAGITLEVVYRHTYGDPYTQI